MLKIRAFTIVELLITFAIVGVIAVVAAPAYSKYLVRSKVSTMATAASAAQFSVANDFYNQGYSFEKITYGAGSQPYLVSKSDFIKAMSVEKGWIRIESESSKLGGRQIDLLFLPIAEENNISWVCYGPEEYFEFMPPECRNAGCQQYSAWSSWSVLDGGTVWWSQNSTLADIISSWTSQCTTYGWYPGCICLSKVNNSTEEFNMEHEITGNYSWGGSWFYTIARHDCMTRTRVFEGITVCDECPSGKSCFPLHDAPT